jgi:transcriptional regulator with XRE-family HTH domain
MARPETAGPQGHEGEVGHMTARRSPTVRRRRLGMELRRLREEADYTLERVAESLECSDSKISRIETGQVGATPRDVRDMLELYGVNGKQRDELMQLAREGRQRGWWNTFDDQVIRTLIGFEAAATSVHVYEAMVVPGLLQTVDYATAVIGAVRPGLRPEEIERRVEVRTARQRDLTQADPPALWVIIDEAALRRPVGGREVMREQLGRLIDAAAWPTVTLQVLPLDAAEHAGMDGSFTIYEFSEPDPGVVYLENATSDLYLETPEELRRYTRLFDHLRAAALKPKNSCEFLTELAGELGTGQTRQSRFPA